MRHSGCHLRTCHSLILNSCVNGRRWHSWILTGHHTWVRRRYQTRIGRRRCNPSWSNPLLEAVKYQHEPIHISNKYHSFVLLPHSVTLSSIYTAIENEGMACSQMAATMPHLQSLTGKWDTLWKWKKVTQLDSHWASQSGPKKVSHSDWQKALHEVSRSKSRWVK